MLVRKVFVTGVGAITGAGMGVDRLWKALFGPPLFTTQQFGPEQFAVSPVSVNPAQWLEKKIVAHNDRFIQLALMAAQEAILQANHPFDTTPASRIGVVISTATGGLSAFREGVKRTENNQRLSPFFVPSFIPNMASAQIAIQYGLQGPNLTISTACAAGTDAIGLAFDWIRLGRADVIIAGGTESLLIPELILGLAATRALSRETQNLDETCLPFGQYRQGMVMGEGSGILVLESEDHVRQRQATPLVEIIGYGTHGDGEHVAAPAQDGHGEIHAIQSCLDDAQITPGAVDYINAHGTGTRLGDKIEWTSIAETVGRHAPVSSIKGHVGHLLGAAGAVEAIATIQMLNSQIIPPTKSGILDPACPLDIVVDTSRPHTMSIALSNSFGFGGQNATIALKNVAASTNT